MFDAKKSVKVITYFGVIPFYLTPATNLLSIDEYIKDFVRIENLSNLYCALIVSFISGMQWYKLFIQKKEKFLLIPLIPLFLVLFYDSSFFKLYHPLLLLFALVVSLVIDLIIYNEESSKWFKKLRIKATILASLSFLL